jgi:type II secretory pathway predicted ATPase ExeA
MGSIIGRIGEENVRKYVWNHIIDEIRTDEEIRARLKPYEPSTSVLFPEMKDSLDPYCDANTTSYKKFLDVFLRQLNAQKKRKFDEVMGDVIQRILQEDTQDSTVAYYFYDFIASDFGINRTWEALTNGSLKQVSGKEFAVIKYIIKLLKREGYSHVFILVDEFEDLTEGRLTKGQLDNYVHNLRTLLDKQREWCLLFAMNPLALERLKKISPPLADRISVRLISLDNLNNDEVKKVMKSYLSLANYTDDIPMTEEAIDYVREICDGNPRRILKAIYALFEEAAKKGVSVMDKAFAEENIPTF